jgi:hypothetical protein
MANRVDMDDTCRLTRTNSFSSLHGGRPPFSTQSPVYIDTGAFKPPSLEFKLGQQVGNIVQYFISYDGFS